MQKQTVISEIAARSGLTRDDVVKALTAYTDVIAEELVTHGGINLPDLGRAKVKIRKAVAARNSVNPRTGNPMVIPAIPAKVTYQPRFGKDFLTKLEATRSKLQST